MVVENDAGELKINGVRINRMDEDQLRRNLKSLARAYKRVKERYQKFRQEIFDAVGL